MSFVVSVQLSANSFIVDMTKYIRHKHKRHQPINPVEPVPKVDYQNQCLTEMSIGQKNISKLIFIGSEDEESPQTPLQQPVESHKSARQPRASCDLSLNRCRPLSRERKGNAEMLRPSLMQSRPDNDEQYDSLVGYESSIIPGSSSDLVDWLAKKTEGPAPNSNFMNEAPRGQQKSINYTVQHRRPKHSVINLQHEDLEGSLEEKRLREREEEKQRRLKDEETRRSEREESIVIPKLQATTLYFEVSDDEAEKETSTRELQLSQTTPSQPGKHLEKSKISYVSETYDEQAPITSGDLPVVGNGRVDIADCKPNEQQDSCSQYMEKQLAGHPDPDQLSCLGLAPILSGTKQIFQVHVYSNFSEKEYFFWLSMSNEMRLLMKARKSVRLSRTEFEILIYHEQTQQYVQFCQLVSNLDRSRFNLYKEARLSPKRQLLGTLCSSVGLNNSKLIVIYFPRVGEEHPPTGRQEGDQMDLQQEYRQNRSRKVDYALTTRVEMAARLKIMSHYELRISQKSMEFKDSNGELKLILGKKGSKRYKIIAGSGLTPVQIFSMVVVQVET